MEDIAYILFVPSTFQQQAFHRKTIAFYPQNVRALVLIERPTQVHIHI